MVVIQVERFPRPKELPFGHSFFRYLICIASVLVPSSRIVFREAAPDQNAPRGRCNNGNGMDTEPRIDIISRFRHIVRLCDGRPDRQRLGFHQCPATGSPQNQEDRQQANNRRYGNDPALFVLFHVSFLLSLRFSLGREEVLSSYYICTEKMENLTGKRKSFENRRSKAHNNLPQAGCKQEGNSCRLCPE